MNILPFAAVSNYSGCFCSWNCCSLFLSIGVITYTTAGVVVTKAPFANFSVDKMYHVIKIPVRLLYPPNNEVVGGYIGFTPSVRPSVCPSVRPSRLPCPLCNIYSSGWILSILATNDHYHERVCRTQWPLTLTYIFKVIWPWLRESCPLCSIYISGWILFIFRTNDHFH